MRGVITLVFDDGYDCVFRHVVPLLEQHHVRAVFALPLKTDRLVKKNAPSLRPWQNWLEVRTAGHEIAAHSLSHRDLTLLPADALAEELRQPKEALAATTLIYPGGAQSENVVKQANKFYAAARTTTYGFENLPPADPWRLKTVDYTKANFSLWKANMRVVWAYATNRWLIETYHVVDIKESMMHHSVRLAQFKKHLEFIKRLPIAVKTIADILHP